jgi:predicted O-methyltransferase YrrM
VDLKRAVRRAAGRLPVGVRDRVRRLVAPDSIDPADRDALVAAAGALPEAAWHERGWLLRRNDPVELARHAATLGADAWQAAGWLLLRDDPAELVRYAAQLPFEEWQRHGWHLTPNSYLSTIPDTRQLGAALWTDQSELPGIDMRDPEQVALLHRIVELFGPEFDALPRTAAAPGRFHLDNGAFESVDAELYHAMIRMHRPATVLEIGSGWSTLLALDALRANRAEGAAGRLVAVEPYPYDFLTDAVAAAPELAELRAVPVQEVPLEAFTALVAGDILFIDSSHVLKIGSDVRYELLEVLPRLAPGVLVHVHDIFLPGEYPREWVLGAEHRFWNEQYLLQAYLAGNRGVEVLWGANWMHRRHPEELQKAFSSYDMGSRNPGSFWLRTVAAETGS